MKSPWKRILPVLLILVILGSICWYLFDYDKEFTRDVLLYQAHFWEQHGKPNYADWFYNLAYRQSDNSAAIAIELADRFKSSGNYTRAEYTLSNAIADHPCTELYAALCKTYVEQDKLMDAVTMLDSIADPTIREQFIALRPAAPMPTPAPGYYSQYISLKFETPLFSAGDSNNDSAGNTLQPIHTDIYVTVNGEYPSVKKNLYTDPIALSSGENTVYALSVSKDGLVSPLSILGYTIGGVIEEVSFADASVEEYVRQLLQIPETDAVFTSDLWTITDFALPAGASAADLKYFTNLEHLRIQDGGSMDLASFASLSKLTQLEISKTIISTENLAQIAALPSLKSLSLSGCSISKIASLSRATGLTALNLSNNMIRDISVLADLENLETLDLSYNALTDLNALAGLGKLSQLNVSYNSLSDVSPLASCTALTALDVSKNSIASISGLEQLTVLQQFSCVGNQIADVSPLAALTQMDVLDLSYNQITDILPLVTLQNMTYFTFTNNQVAELPAWDRECQLVYIDGSNNLIDSLKPLKKFLNLNTVIMDNNNISEVNFLGDCPNMIQVDVVNNPVSDVSGLLEHSIIVHYTPKV